MRTRVTVDDYRMTTGALMACTRRQLRKIAQNANSVLGNRLAVYDGLDRDQTVAAARHRRDDALFALALKKAARS